MNWERDERTDHWIPKQGLKNAPQASHETDITTENLLVSVPSAAEECARTYMLHHKR
jgi:hypothetical protein